MEDILRKCGGKITLKMAVLYADDMSRVATTEGHPGEAENEMREENTGNSELLHFLGGALALTSRAPETFLTYRFKQVSQRHQNRPFCIRISHDNGDEPPMFCSYTTKGSVVMSKRKKADRTPAIVSQSVVDAAMTATMAAAKIDPSHTTKVMYTQTTPSAINAATAAVGYVFPTLKKTEQANRNALKRKFCEVDTSFCMHSGIHCCEEVAT